MQNTPKVSIILPNYNHEKFLDERLSSILNQTHEDFEVIILDDASTDNSVAVIEKYLYDPRILHFIKNTKNSGSTFIQWKKGLELAQGTYVWIAESDDISHPTFLEAMVQTLDGQKNTGLAFCPSKWIDEQSQYIHTPEHEEGEDFWGGNALIENDFLIGNVIYNASSAVFRRNLIPKINFEETQKYKYTGDWFFWVQLVSNMGVQRISQRLNSFRRHVDNVSFKSDREGLQFIEGLKIVKYIFGNYKISFTKSRKVYLYWTRKFIQSNLENKQEILKKLPMEFKLYYKIFSIKK
jgi:glycosyltransferase involved in cell wall biosynthesis